MRFTLSLIFLFAHVSSLKLRNADKQATPAYVWTPLWGQYEGTCMAVFFGAGGSLGAQRAPLTLYSINNHGLCFQADSFADLCHCRSISTYPKEANRNRGPYQVYQENFVKDQWDFDMGKTCGKRGFDMKGHAHSLHADDWILPQWDQGCKAEKFQLQARNDWFEWHWPWMQVLDGTGTWDAGMQRMASWISYPAVFNTDPPHHLATVAEAVEFLGTPAAGAVNDQYCGGGGLMVCGPKGRSREYISISVCKVAVDVTYVIDEIIDFNPTNLSDASDPASGLYISLFRNNKWRWNALSLVDLFKGFSGKQSERLQCSQYVPTSAA